MATAWDEYQRQLLDAVLHGGRGAQMPVQPHPGTLPVYGPAMPPSINPATYLMRTPSAATPPQPVRPRTQQAPPKAAKQPTHEELVQKAADLDQRINDLERYMQTAEFMRNPNPQYQSQLVAWKGEREQIRAALNETPEPQPSGVFGNAASVATDMAQAALSPLGVPNIPDVPERLEPAISLLNPFDDAGTANIGTGFAIQGERDPKAPANVAAQSGAQMRAGMESMEAARNTEQYEQYVIQPLREEISEQEMVNAIALTDIEIQQLELVSSPTLEQSERLELLKIEREQLDVLNFVLYGVEPEQKDQPWYRDIAEQGLNLLSYADRPRQWLRPVSGYYVYAASKSNTPLARLFGANPVIAQTNMSFSPQEIESLYEQGGGTAVWEGAVAQVPTREGWGQAQTVAWHAATDTMFDPLSYLGMVATITKGIPILGRTMAGLNAAANLPGDVALGTLRTAGKVVGKTPGIKQGIDWASRPTAETIARRDVLEPTVEGLRTIKAGGYVDEAGTITAPDVTPRVTEIGTTYGTPVRKAGVTVDAPVVPRETDAAIPEPVDVAPTVGPSAVDTPREAPYIATKVERTADIKAGDRTVLDPMFANRRVIDRITARLATLPRDVARRVDEAISESNIGFNARHAELEDTFYPKGTFYQKMADQSLTAQEGSIRQVELFREITGEAPPPGEVQLLKGVKYTDERGPIAMAERIIYGTDAQSRTAIQQFEKLWLPRDEAWGRKFLQKTQELRSRWAATLDAVDTPAPPAATAPNRFSSMSDEDVYAAWRAAQSRAFAAESDFNPSIGAIVRKAGKSPGFGKTTREEVLAAAQEYADLGEELVRRGRANESEIGLSRTVLDRIRNNFPDTPDGGVGFSAIDSNPTARRGLDIVNKYLDRHSGQQADELTAVADDADDWIEPFIYRKDKLAAFAKTGELPRDTVQMLDEAVPLAQAVQTPESVVRTGKRAFSAQQKKIMKALVKKFGEDAEIKRWDIFEEALLQNAGNVKNTMRDFEAILGVRSTELKGLLKPLADFYNGAKTAIRHAWMYNTPRLGYNLSQDTATDTFAHMADGQIDAAALAYRGYRNAIQDQLENSRYRPTQKIGQYLNESFPSTVTDDVQGLHQILELDIGEEVASMTGARFDDVTKEWVEEGKTWWTRKAGLAGSVVAPDFARNLRTMFDDVKRLSTKTDFLQRNIVQSRDEFYDYLRTYAAKTGEDADAWISKIEASGADYHGHTLFGPSDVREAIGGGRGEHLARRWRSHLTALDKDARSHMRKYLFSYRQTNADSLIGQVFLFHYWMTRASVLHTRLVLDHPWLAAAYFRAWEGMEKQDTSHLPAWAQQFISLNVGPYGMLGLASPTALMVGLGTVLDLNGLAEADGWQDYLQVLPVNPVIMAAASVLWDDRTPDLTGTNQTRQFYRAAANYLNQKFDLGYDGVIPDYVGEGTYWLQNTLRNVLPGGEPLAAPSPSERDTQGVQFYASQIMQEQGTLLDEQGAPTDEANQVMANIDAGLYSGEIEQQALDRFVTDTMAGRLAMTQFPIQTVTPGFAANQRTLNRQGDDAFFGETTLDTSSLTGFGSTARERTPEEQAADFTLRMTDAGGPEATTLLGQLAQYDLLGDDEQRATWDSYYQVLYGAGETLQAQLGGDAMDFGFATISYDEWDALDHDSRAGLLDQWIAASGYKDEWNAYRDLRDEYETAHPETAGFKEWQDQIRESIQERGMDGTLNELLDISPSFAAWWQGQNTDPAYVQIALMRPEAYLAAEGVKPGHWDSNAIVDQPTTDISQINPMDVIAPQSSDGFGSGKSFDHMTTSQRIDALNEDIVEYQQDLAAWDAEVSAITGGRSFESMNPLAQQALLPQLPNQPKGSAVLRSYIDWMKMQPASADVSVAAYIRWYEMMEQEEAVAA